jgi:hypothetical protein
MQLNLVKIKITTCAIFLLVLFPTCNKKSGFENQITITINSVDKKTKQRRINMFDTLEVRKESFGLLKKTFPIERKYVMDSSGSVKIRIDTSKIYDFSVSGIEVLGGDMYYPGYLKNGQEVNIEVFSIDER